MCHEMKFLILNNDYPDFSRSLYANNPRLRTAPYSEQMKARNQSLFGMADFCSYNLIKLGHEAQEIHPNISYMQAAWAKEKGFKPPYQTPYIIRLRRGIVPWISPRWDPDKRWLKSILAEQIRRYKPDVVLNQSMDSLDNSWLKELKPYMRLLVGQLAAPLPNDEDFSGYDLFISSLPNYVDYFRKLGIPSELNRLGFEPRVLDHLDLSQSPKTAVSFIGSLSTHHTDRCKLLNNIAQTHPLDAWGLMGAPLPKKSPLLKRFHGRAWGIDMYQAIHDSRITLNQHIGISGPYANNMRLYEATGVGAMLLTDWKENLSDMFEPGREVAVYKDEKECSEKIAYYLEHENERAEIARAGQKRTLSEHNYLNRMQEFTEIIKKII